MIQTRQKDDELFRLKEDAGAITAGGSAEFPIRRVSGYGVIRFLAISTAVLRLRIEQAPTSEGPWVETDRLASVASTSGSGQQLICTGIAPCSVFMRIFLDNVGAADAAAELSGFGHPIAGGDGGGGGGGGGPASIVELEDGNGGVTRASVKTDGTLIGAQGSVLAGGRDPSGAQQALAVNLSGQLTTADAPGATITTAADVVVGVGATVPLSAPPAGTRRITVEVTGGDATTRIRVREVGGAAGGGKLLVLLGSTMYGEAGGAIAALEVENVVGPAAAVMIQFERD